MLISICIPTYNSGEKLERLLDSIKIQTFKDYEIIISDDSRNNDVKEIIDTKYADLNIKYYKNEISLGTPNNWNNAVAKSTGDWINLMHHDDWYNDKNSLNCFVNCAIKNPNTFLIFSAYQHYYLENNTIELLGPNVLERGLLKLSPYSLFKTFMGNPSTTLINRTYKPYNYDVNFKWLIDYDFFVTLLTKKNSFAYVTQNIVSLGMHKDQVTAFVFQNPTVEIPESYLLIKKHGSKILKNIYAYDFFWRLYRNLGIKSIDEFNNYLGKICDERCIIQIIIAQSKIKASTLKKGPISKTLMTYNYFINYLNNL